MKWSPTQQDEITLAAHRAQQTRNGALRETGHQEEKHCALYHDVAKKMATGALAEMIATAVGAVMVAMEATKSIYENTSRYLPSTAHHRFQWRTVPHFVGGSFA